MNPQHRPFVKEIPGSKTAFIFVHGIMSTPYHFREFIPMVPENCSVYNILLSGHGGSVKGFSKASMIRWQQQVNQVFARAAARHEQLFVVAHSMGTLLSYQAAKRYRNKILQLFYLAVPLVPQVGYRSLRSSYHILSGKIQDDDHWTNAAKNAYSIDVDTRLWQYIGWIPRFLELFKKMNKTTHIMAGNRLPVLALQSGKDELVSSLSIRLLAKYSNVVCKILYNSGHQYYPPKDWERIQKEFTHCLEQLNLKTD